jgi:hypothetical protein
VSGPGVGVAVATQPGALLTITPGPGTPAGDTVPPPVTIFTTHEHSLHNIHCSRALNTHKRALDRATYCQPRFVSRSQEATGLTGGKPTEETHGLPANSPPRASPHPSRGITAYCTAL